MRSYVLFAAWSLLAGAGIPLVGVFNSGIARNVGNPFAAATLMFAVALVLCAAVTIPLYGAPSFGQIARVPAYNYASGLVMCFYALSATIVIPRFGAASFIAFILIAQLTTSAAVDQFGLFGMARRPVEALRLAGLAIIATGILVMEIGNLKKALG